MTHARLDRRTFVKAAASLGALSIVGVGATTQSGCVPKAKQEAPDIATMASTKPLEAEIDPATGKLSINEDIQIRYTACLGCYAACGKRVKIDRATNVILSTGGNPYHPSCAYPNLAFEDSLEEAYLSFSYAPGKGNSTRGTSCARGHGTHDAYMQPDRITMPLKRAGKRGEGLWKPISWDQLISEVTEGGKLFAEVGEDRAIEGFKAIRDTETPLDKDNPGFGPKSNQLVILGGRGGDGRTPFSQRFAKCFGTNNVYGHTSSCGSASYAWTLLESSSVYTYPDLDESEYVLWLGEFPGANGKSMQSMAKRVTERCLKGLCRMDVVDPHLGNGCVTPGQDNISWVPITAQTDDAFVLGMIRWMMENNAINQDFLTCASVESARAKGYASFTNASKLVITDAAHPSFGKLLRAEDVGLEIPPAPTDGKTAPVFHAVIDVQTGEPVRADACTSAVLEFEGSVRGIQVRSAYLFLKDSAFEHTLDEYATVTRVPVASIERIAQEFSSHGTKASVACLGATAGARGIYIEWAHLLLKALIGSNQMVGGSMPTTTPGGPTTADGSRYLLGTVADAPSAAVAKAALISRTGMAFSATDEYLHRVKQGEEKPVPKLPWFNIKRPSDTQALISMANAYPYKPKILVTWMFNTLQATPGAMRNSILERLQDTNNIPLHIVCDVVLGEHTLFADYVVPDTNPFESFGIVAQQTDWKGKGSAVRWPVVSPGTIDTGDGRHASYEAFCIDVAKACNVPGFGDDALEDASGTKYPLNDASDFFVKAIANLAYAGDVVSDIDQNDVRIQGLDDLPESWKSSVSEEEWPKVLKVLSRGGRFWPVAQSADETGRATYGASQETFLYSEGLAASKNFLTGMPVDAVLTHMPETLSNGVLMTELFSVEEYPFKGISYKARFRSISMLANSPLMQDLSAYNFLEINDIDAAECGIANGDIVKITNPGGDIMEGVAMVRGGVARSTFGVAYGYGHIGYGAQHIKIEGNDAISGSNEPIGAGVHLQTMLDPTVTDVLYPLCDPVSAAPVRGGALYKIEKK